MKYQALHFFTAALTLICGSLNANNLEMSAERMSLSPFVGISRGTKVYFNHAQPSPIAPSLNQKQAGEVMAANGDAIVAEESKNLETIEKVMEQQEQQKTELNKEIANLSKELSKAEEDNPAAAPGIEKRLNEKKNERQDLIEKMESAKEAKEITEGRIAEGSQMSKQGNTLADRATASEPSTGAQSKPGGTETAATQTNAESKPVAEQPNSEWEKFKETGKFTSNGKEFSVGGETPEEKASNAQAYSKLYQDNNGKLTAEQMKASGLMMEGTTTYSGISKGENAGHTWTNSTSGESYTYQPASASGNTAAAPALEPVQTTATGVATNTPRTTEMASPIANSNQIVSREELQNAGVDGDYAGPTCGLVWDAAQGRYVSRCSAQ